jgi:uncharacterized cupredoxin-like copper-binding protein
MMPVAARRFLKGDADMTVSRRGVMALATGGLSVVALGRAAQAATVVKITLWDKGAASMEGMEGMAPMGLAMPGADMAMATMGITVDPPEIAAGEVKFQVSNDSTEFYHSVTISAIADASMALPYLADQAMVDAETLGVTAKSRDLGLRERETVTATLTPGTYVLYCNVAGHYVMGMWTLLKVTG